MAVNGDNNKGRRRYRFGRRREKTQTAELAGRLAPLEEQIEAAKADQAISQDKASDDTIRVDTAALKVPQKLVEEEREGADIFHLDKIVIYILIFMLAFIAFVAWQVTLMPPSAK